MTREKKLPKPRARPCLDMGTSLLDVHTEVAQTTVRRSIAANNTKWPPVSEPPFPGFREGKSCNIAPISTDLRARPRRATALVLRRGRRAIDRIRRSGPLKQIGFSLLVPICADKPVLIGVTKSRRHQLAGDYLSGAPDVLRCRTDEPESSACLRSLLSCKSRPVPAKTWLRNIPGSRSTCD
jgi:hypothetical protein